VSRWAVAGLHVRRKIEEKKKGARPARDFGTERLFEVEKSSSIFKAFYKL
jgi:hypothetical protein